MIDNISFLGDLTPEEILVYYDGPRAFTTRSSEGNLLLVSWLNELPVGDRYVVTPISSESLRALRDNQLTLRDVLELNTLWVVEQDLSGTIVRAEILTLDDIEQKYPHSLPARVVF